MIAAMKLPNIARTAAVLLSSTAAAVTIGSAAQAGANTVEFPQVPTLAYGAAVCWTNIRTWADTSPEWPGRAILNVRALPAAGLGPLPYVFVPLCNVLTTVAWRNTTTGATGTYRNVVVAGMYGSIQYSLFQPTGPGHIEVDVTTNNASIPAHGSFDVPGAPPAPAPPR